MDSLGKDSNCRALREIETVSEYVKNVFCLNSSVTYSHF